MSYRRKGLFGSRQFWIGFAATAFLMVIFYPVLAMIKVRAQ
jgi:hypothetical protein